MYSVHFVVANFTFLKEYNAFHYIPLNVITNGGFNGYVSIYGVIITLQTNTTQSLEFSCPAI